MKLRINIISLLFLLICCYSHGQLDEYSYKRELIGVSESWHRISLPDQLFGKLSSPLADIRIFGVTDANDTIEAPYILNIKKDKITRNSVQFKTINQSRNQAGYYFTFEIPSREVVNQIKLDFGLHNFDWKLKLEGSHDQREWFTVADDYRILSIINDITDYQFTDLTFPRSSYRYFRVMIPSKKKPQFISANINISDATPGNYRTFEVRSMKSQENKKTRQTILDIDLQAPFSICRLNIDVKEEVDYYRPMTVAYVADSFKTAEGWKYRYRMLSSTTLSSIEKNEVRFSSTILQKLRITISNYDNQPITINNINIKGYEHELITRLSIPATYFLAYGKKHVRTPNYDITRFPDKIPQELMTLRLGPEEKVEQMPPVAVEPLFKNKAWLWAIMITIILLLGWFSIKMMRKV